MSFYRTGTIALTNGSAAVVGTGTNFIAGAVVGECIQAPDSKLYEILSINSATSITLGQVYLGSTASGQSYSIVPTQSYIRDLAGQAAALVNGFQSTKDNAVLVTNADKATVVDTDKVAIKDVVTGLGKWITWANIKSVLATWINSSSIPASFTTLTTTGDVTLGDSTVDRTTVNGILGVGQNPNSGIGVYASPRALAGSTQMGIFSFPIAAVGTSSIEGVKSSAGLGTSVTASAATAFHAQSPNYGVGASAQYAYGLLVDEITGATNNYALYLSSNSGGNRWAMYSAGTAPSAHYGNLRIGSTAAPTNALDVTGAMTVSGNTTLGDASTDTVTVNGHMGVGVAASSDSSIYIAASTLVGSAQYGVVSSPIGNSSATTQIVGVRASPKTAAAVFTASDVIGFRAVEQTKGAGSTITNKHGVYVEDQTQGTNNYGITSLVSSGTNKWNVYASGTANSAFAGNVRIGSTGAPTVALDVTGGINTTDIITSAVSSATAVKNYIYNANTGIASSAAVGAGNASSTASAVLLATLGTNYTTIGGYIQDGAALDAGDSLSGGLSIMARHPTGGNIRFYTAGYSSERMRITADGTALVGKTATTANGGILQVSNGITFPATQVPCSDVNTLDDYEEGTFTPVISGGTVAGVGTYTRQAGSYTKIGRQVTLTIGLIWTAHTGTGVLRIAGLPFAQSSEASIYPFSFAASTNLTTSGLLGVYSAPSATYLIVSQYYPNANNTDLVMDASGGLYFTHTYFTA